MNDSILTPDTVQDNLKPVYSVAEFAALFNRHKSWAYRLIYKGKIKVISKYGLMMIPATEIETITGSAGRYMGRSNS